MTLEEMLAREAIRLAITRYTMAGDRLRVDDFVALFAEDGVLESNGFAPGERVRREGRAAIRAFFTNFEERPPVAGVARPKFLRHHLSTCLIELTGPDTATARTYFGAHTQIGLDHAGHYADAFRKVGDDWLIAERRVFTNFRSPDSLFPRTE
jgi:hypothetical protein